MIIFFLVWQLMLLTVMLLQVLEDMSDLFLESVLVSAGLE